MSIASDPPNDAVRSRGAALALGEIECLANEMAALMKMGIPLAAGLRELAPSMRGSLRKFVKKLASKIESGKDLSAALHEERERLPGFFRAVVDAGIRGGDPAIALKSIAETARRIDEHRRLEFHSLLYPLIVGLVATALICAFLSRILPAHIRLYEARPLPDALAWANSLAEFVPSYWFVPPLVLLIAWLAILFRPVSWKGASSNSSWLGVGSIPTQGNIVAASRWSTMLEVLTLLLTRRTPLDESLRLAASVALPARNRLQVDDVAQRLRNGERLTEADYLAAGLPRAIASAIAAPRRADALIQVLRQLETEYRWRAHDLRRRFNGPWIGTITVAIAGAFVLGYVILVILPIVQVYFDVVNNRIC
jgi:type II secretory pathway component PulF